MNDTKIDMEQLVQEVLALPIDSLLMFVSGLPPTLNSELHADRRITLHIHETLHTMDQDARKAFSNFVCVFRQQMQLPIDQAEKIVALERELAYLRGKLSVGAIDKLKSLQ